MTRPSAFEQVTGGRHASLDALFREARLRRPDAVALRDPPDREAFTDHAPRVLTYSQADRAISAIAARLRGAGLPADAVIGLQLPNIAEATLAILGVLRAGMIPALIPLLWRKADAVAALSGISPKAVIVCRRLGETDHAQLAAEIAAEMFSIRHVFAFGTELPDGVTPLDDVFAAEAAAFHDPLDIAPDNIAVVTFDVSPSGTLACARSHRALVACGLGPVMEADLRDDAAILSPYAPASLAGLALATLPWLLTGGTLHLHQPFDGESLAAQVAGQSFDLIVLPGPIASRVADAGVLQGHAGLKAIALAWRAPESIAGGISPRLFGVPLIDVRLFGEAGLVATRRQLESRPAPFLAGIIAPAFPECEIGEVLRTANGTVGLRGAMLAQAPYPTGAGHASAPAPDAERIVDTGFPCLIERDTLIVTGPPQGLVSLGGYRFALKDLQDRLNRIERGCTLAALPNALIGYRLAGESADRSTMRRSLTEFGANPLIVRAFRERSDEAPAA